MVRPAPTARVPRPGRSSGGTGPTGASGSVGPHGRSLAATLASGEHERGVWIAADPEEPVLGHTTVASITFPVPLSGSIPPENAIYVTKKGEQIDSEGVEVVGKPCAGSAGAPTAPAEHICIYADVEKLVNASFHTIATHKNSPGGDRIGALLEFEVKNEGAAEVLAQGSWAVTG